MSDSASHEKAEEVYEDLSGERLIVLFQVAQRLEIPFEKYYASLSEYTGGADDVVPPELAPTDVRILVTHLRTAANSVAFNAILWSEEEMRLISRLLPPAKTQEEIEAYNERRRQLISQAAPEEKSLREMATSEAKDESILYEPGNEDVAFVNAVSEIRAVDALATLVGKENVHRVLSRSYLQVLALALVDFEPAASTALLEGLPDTYVEPIKAAIAKRLSDNAITEAFRRFPGRGGPNSNSAGGAAVSVVGKKFAEQFQTEERGALLRIIKQYPNQLAFIEGVLGVVDGKTVLDVSLEKE